MARYDVTNGQTSTGKILNTDSMYVSMGGTADNTTVNGNNTYYGVLIVSNGGTATNTTLNSRGGLYVSNGGSATNTTVNSWGHLEIKKGGTATKTTVNSGGFMYVYIGATATEIEAVDGAYLDFAVAPGTYIKGTSAGSAFEINNGVANNFTLNHDTLDLHAGATANNTTVNEWGHLFVDYGGTATNTTVNGKNGSIVVYAGGTATNITVNADGNLTVSAGGTATEIKAVEGANLGFFVGPDTYAKGTSAGSAFEIKNGVANNFTVNSGFLTLSSGGTADNTTVNAGGSMYVSYGGTATNATVNSYGLLIVSNGGTADKTSVNGNNTYYGVLIVSNGGTATNTTLNRGDLYVSNGGKADITTVNKGGYLSVISGGTADIITVNEGGGLIVWSGGTATGITAVEGTDLRLSVAPDSYIAGTSAGSAFEIKNGVANNFTLNRNELWIENGGKADNTTVNKDGYMKVSSGGTADNTTVNENGRLYVSNGGTADNTTVNEGGDLYVYGGGTATNTTVNSDGYIRVSSGGTATNTTVNYWGYFDVLNGGTADNTTVNSSGCLEVSSGGTATNTKVNYWGYLYLQSGGTATEIEAVDDAYLLFAVAPDTYAKGTSAGSAFEIKNGVATNFTLTCGELLLSSGGTASKTTLSSHGYIRVSSGGKADNTTVNAGGSMWVFSGGTADNTTVNENGHLYVYGGGKANSTTVKSGGKLDLFEDGVLTGRMTFSSGAVVSAYEGGGIIDFDLTHTTPSEGALVNDLSIVQGTPMYTLTVNGAQSIGAYKLADGASGFGSKTEITVRNPVGTDLGVLTVDSKSNTFSYGGKTYTLQLNDESLFVIVNSESGSPNIVTGDVNGHTVITEGSSALGVNVNGGGMLEIQPGGKGNNIMVSNGGLLLTQDAQVKGVTVDKGGAAYLGSDTVMASLVLNGGEAHVESDGWAFQMSKGKTVSSNTIVKNDGMLYISGGGHVEGLLASDGGHVIVESDGSLEVAKFAGATLDALNGANVSSAILLEGGRMNVFAGGSAQGVTISEGGILAVESGGEVNHINVSAGGVLTGVVKNGTTIRMYGGTIDFDISGFTPDSAPAYLYEDTDIASDEAYPCTLTVGDAQAYGTYGLMSYAYGFSCTVTVQDTSGKELGTLAAGSAVNINGVDYTLNIGGSPAYPLTVTIADNEAPTILNITADITAPTTSDVTLTAEFSDNAALASKQYRIGDGAWTDYTTGVLVTGNATVYFKAVDTAGNETTDQYAVTNIDREKPEVKNIQLSTIEFTNQDVTVTADFTDNVEVASKQYRIGDGAWTDYATGVTVTENATVYFKAVDTAGNESDVVPCGVPIIDKVPPTITITPSTTEPGAESVTLSVVCKDETSMSSILQYRIGDGAWQDCTAGVVVTENTTVSFKTYDTAGNETIESYAVTNIKVVVPDTTKPVVTNMQASTTDPTNQNVIVTAEFTDDVGVVSRLYNLNNGEWKAYPDGGVVVTENNTTVYFQAVDAAGNKSEINSYKVSNIDKVKPTISVTPSTTEPAESVELIPKFADNVKLATRQYRIGNGDWQNYTDVAVKVTTNTTVYFKATDAAGNVATDFYEVSNIKPAAREYGVEEPLNNYLYDKKNKTAPLNLNVYSLDPQIVEAGTSEIQIDKTGSVQKDDRKNFVGKDKEGALDPADFTKITLNSAARIRFNLGGTDAMKFTVWSLIEGEDKKHNPTYKMKSLQSTKLTKQKNTALYTADTKDLLLEAGTYYISMESTGGKKTTEGFYSVQLNDAASDFFTKGDKSDDWGDMKTFGPNGAVGDVGVIDESEPEILTDWVGFGDVKDFKHFTLSSAAKLSFSLNASDASKFTIWKLNSKTNKKEVTTYSLKSLQATTLKKSKNAEGYTATTKSLILDAGEYYFSVESTNAKKGGSADYSVSLNALDNATEFFTKGDNSDDWGDMKTAGPAGAVGDVGVIQGANENLLTDWVGYSDTIDYKKFTLNTDAKLNFEVYSGDAAKFTVWCLDSSTKKNVTTYSLKSLMTVKIKGGEDAKILDTLTLAKGDYYFSMESTNAKKGGSADYNVGVIQFRAQSAQEECALAMPETASVASVLTTPDSLGFDQNDADMLAGSYLDSASDKLFGESGGGLLASL